MWKINIAELFILYFVLGSFCLITRQTDKQTKKNKTGKMMINFSIIIRDQFNSINRMSSMQGGVVRYREGAFAGRSFCRGSFNSFFTGNKSFSLSHTEFEMLRT